MITLQSILSILEALAIVGGLVGAFLVFVLRGRKDETVKIQQTTITALKDQLDTIEKKLKLLEEDNTRLKQTIENIQAALKHKGIHVTIDGEMVIIEQKESKTSYIRQHTRAPRSQTSPASTPEKQEE